MTTTTRSKKAAPKAATTTAKKNNCVKNKVPIKKKETKKNQKKKASPPATLPPFDITDVREHDILLGRGKGYFEHPGNVRFLQLTGQFRSMYKTAQRSAKQEIAQRAKETILLCGIGHDDPIPRFLVEQPTINPDGSKKKKSKKKKKKIVTSEQPSQFYRLATEEEIKAKLTHRLRENDKKKSNKNSSTAAETSEDSSSSGGPPPPHTSSSIDIVSSNNINHGQEREEVDGAASFLPYLPLPVAASFNDHQDQVVEAQVPPPTRPLSPTVVSVSDENSSIDSYDGDISFDEHEDDYSTSSSSFDDEEEDNIKIRNNEQGSPDDMFAEQISSLSISANEDTIHPQALALFSSILPPDNNAGDAIMDDDFEPICIPL